MTILELLCHTQIQLRTLVVGAPGDDDGGTDRGAVYIFKFTLDGTLVL